MFTVVIGNEIPVGRIDYRDPLNGFLETIVWPSAPCPAPEIGMPACITVGANSFTLVVEDFRFAGGTGWVKLVPAAARAARFDVEVFSGQKGASFEEVIESRTPIHGPPELAAKLPAIVIDCTLAALLGDVCWRSPGWAWWSESNGLGIGLPVPQTVSMDGVVVAHSGSGTEARLAALPPRPGTRLRLPCGTSGVILLARVMWQAGAEPVYLAMLGAIPAGRRRPPRSTVWWPAKVVQRDPFLVDLSDEERPGKGFLSRARLMGRRSDRQRFREDIPVQVEDVLEAAVKTGGVSVLPPKVYTWAEASPAAAYRVESASAEVVVAEKIVTRTADIEESFARRKSHVKERWDVNKG